MDSIKKVEMAIEKIQNGHFGYMQHWTSGGYTSVAIGSVLSDDVYHETTENARIRKKCLQFRALLGLAYANGKDNELVLVDKKLLEKIEKIVPKVAEKLVETVDFLKPLAETRK